MDTAKKKIAIIGGGVSGLSASYFLEESAKYEVTLFEKNQTIGGHAVTVDVPLKRRVIPVDPIVYLFSFPRYPFFSAWLKNLEVDLGRILFSQYTYNTIKNVGMFYAANLSPNLLKSIFCEGRILTNCKNLTTMKKILNRINQLEKNGLLDCQMCFDEFFKNIPEATPEFRGKFFLPCNSIFLPL